MSRANSVMLKIPGSATKISPPENRYNGIHPGYGNQPPQSFKSLELMRYQGLGWGAALSLSLPQGQQHPSETLRAKRNPPFLEHQSPLSPLQCIHSLMHPEPHISEQIQPLSLTVSVSSTPLYIFLCHSQDCFFPALWSCLLWLPSPPLPSPAAPTLSFPSPSPAKGPPGDKHQPNRFFLSLKSRNFLY